MRRLFQIVARLLLAQERAYSHLAPFPNVETESTHATFAQPNQLALLVAQCFDSQRVLLILWMLAKVRPDDCHYQKMYSDFDCLGQL